MKKIFNTFLFLLCSISVTAQGSADLASFNGGNTYQTLSASEKSNNDGWVCAYSHILNSPSGYSLWTGVRPVLNGGYYGGYVGTESGFSYPGGLGTLTLTLAPYTTSRGINLSINVRCNNEGVVTKKEIYITLNASEAPSYKAFTKEIEFNLEGNITEISLLNEMDQSNSTTLTAAVAVIDLSWTGYNPNEENNDDEADSIPSSLYLVQPTSDGYTYTALEFNEEESSFFANNLELTVTSSGTAEFFFSTVSKESDIVLDEDSATDPTVARYYGAEEGANSIELDNSVKMIVTDSSESIIPFTIRPASYRFNFVASFADTDPTVTVKEGVATVINQIEETNSVQPSEYFNLQGIKVIDPSNGVFIRKQGDKTSKVMR